MNLSDERPAVFTLKERILRYWTRRAEGFGDVRRKELSGDDRSRWSREILPWLPSAAGEGTLRALDIGTGAGFFAVLLAQQGLRVTLQDERSRITYLLPGERRAYPRGDYFYLSVFPLEGRAEGVEIRGAFYELADATLTAGYPLGVSNEYAPGSDCITLAVRRGALLVVETMAD